MIDGFDGFDGFDDFDGFDGFDDDVSLIEIDLRENNNDINYEITMKRRYLRSLSVKVSTGFAFARIVQIIITTMS
jgi:hypothetical protein